LINPSKLNQSILQWGEQVLDQMFFLPASLSLNHQVNKKPFTRTIKNKMRVE